MYAPAYKTRLRYESRASFDDGDKPIGIQCDCGNVLSWSPGLDESCDKCGAEYNSSGQLLADRSQWGLETGEVFDPQNLIETLTRTI